MISIGLTLWKMARSNVHLYNLYAWETQSLQFWPCAAPSHPYRVFLLGRDISLFLFLSKSVRIFTDYFTFYNIYVLLAQPVASRRLACCPTAWFLNETHNVLIHGHNHIVAVHYLRVKSCANMFTWHRITTSCHGRSEINSKCNTAAGNLAISFWCTFDHLYRLSFDRVDNK